MSRLRLRGPMQAGLLIAGVVAAGLSLLTIPFGLVAPWLWPLCGFFGLCAGILVVLSFRAPPVTQVVAVQTPSPPQEWYHAAARIPPPMPVALPVVVPKDPAPFPYVLPATAGGSTGSPAWCPHCGMPQPGGVEHCVYCGKPG
jgi:hypothetical protein